MAIKTNEGEMMPDAVSENKVRTGRREDSAAIELI